MDPVTDAPVSAAQKALDYAENQLGVHTVYTETLAKREELDSLMTELAEARDGKRRFERQIADREMEILTNELSAHPEMSAAAMDKHLKRAYHSDPSLRELRESLVECVNTLDGMELDRSVLEVDIKIAVSRMSELGGYLQYLAAVKQSTFTSSS